jgi:hypothetical protein
LNDFNAAGKTLKDVAGAGAGADDDECRIEMFGRKTTKSPPQHEKNLATKKNHNLRSNLSIYLPILSTTRLIHCCLSSPLLLLLNVLID